ncbi:winged helix-turn-helix domain-containing protein [Methanosarcina sp. KYL-1]|uniref:helix-turn-helix transcriptional regulator n=1 Tax=Methanosarcina sp. KYL-1 TaxID=2602068 RepID=UPI002100F84F|nr:winged helix-turn-helix domain-containing protein [Methanosarcina sp. KYL-1]MCQ1537247.1 winged helix-turn-helix domain-containing protein [Methanosarcina sp. KYL-1]
MKLELLGTLFLSDKRKDLLLLLMEEPRNIDEVKNILNVTSSAIMTQIKILISQGLIIHDDDLYKLSDIGKVVVKKMKPLLNTLGVFSENMDYWENHNISAIPVHLLDRIEDLGHCEFVEPDLDRMYETPQKIEENLIRSAHVKEVSSYFNPAYPSTYVELIRKGTDVSLIITKPVFERLKKEYGTALQEYLKRENAKIFVCDCPIRVASSVVTNRFMALSLFYKNGIYHNHAMMSSEESALKWGEDLFLHYMKNSKEITGVELENV